MLEGTIFTLILAAISDQEEGTGNPSGELLHGPVPSSTVHAHWTRSLQPRHHLVAGQEELLNREIRRHQRLIEDNARRIERLRDERSRLK